MADRRRKDAPTRGFTLIELLVVVVIIALLLSLLVPSLREFRAHARTVACQSNLGSIGKGIINYALDLDSFPITADRTGAPVSWRYGGWTGSNAPTWKGHLGETYYIPTQKRPLSAYMYRNSQLDAQTRLPMFRCPAETQSRRSTARDLAPSDMPAYEDLGTSYHLNWHWFEHQTRLPGVPTTQDLDPVRVPRGQRIWWKYMQQNVSRFVILLEDPADYALTNRTQVVGNHGKFSKHNFAFLDGHAEYLHTDTRYSHQAAWTVVDEAPPYKEWRVD